MTQPAQSHLFNCVLWHNVDNGNVRYFSWPVHLKRGRYAAESCVKFIQLQRFVKKIESN